MSQPRRDDADETTLRSAGTILYVEDEAFVREVTAEVLRCAGYHVLVAKNAAEAIESFQVGGRDVELLVTDVILPGETGRALAATLRGTNSQLKVLYVTGYAQQIGVRSTSFEDCLAKPFSSDTLLEKVEQMIDNGESQIRRPDEAMLACAGA